MNKPEYIDGAATQLAEYTSNGQGANEEGKLLLGYGNTMPVDGSAREVQRGIGFMSPLSRAQASDPIWHQGEGSLITVGVSGSGKTRGAAIPALLTHRGSVIVLDVKGELYATTAAYRRRLGQTVTALDLRDECEATDGGTQGSLNPMAIFSLPGTDIDETSLVMATLLQGGQPSYSKDPFFDINGLSINAGVLAHIANAERVGDRRLSAIRDLYSGDFEYTLANLLDKNAVESALAREEFKVFLQHPARETRPSVQSTAQMHFRLMGLPRVRARMDTSTLNLNELLATDGPGHTVYIICPPAKLDSHRSVLRLWLGVLLQVLCRRERRSFHETLVLVDEAASLGEMEPIKRAITLLRGYSVRTWTFWQDLSQLRHNYPNDWPTLLNNAGCIQLLRPRNYGMAKEFSDLVGGFSPEQLMQMRPDEQVLLQEGSAHPVMCRRPDYLRDALFAGRYDANPMFSKGSGEEFPVAARASTQVSTNEVAP